MIAIQVLIIIFAIAIMFFGLRGRATHIGRAWRKLATLLLASLMVVAVIFPNATSKFAQFLGVGRGADLLLYILTLAFIAFVLNNYLQRQDERNKLYILSRQLALLEARKRYKIKDE